MAIIQDDSLTQDPNSQGSAAQGQGSAQSSDQGGDVQSSSGSTDVGSNVSTAGVGAGGTGGWTNIQAYLNANQGNTGSADALSSSVGGKFDSEASRISSDADQKKSAAMQAAQTPAGLGITKSKSTADSQTPDQVAPPTPDQQAITDRDKYQNQAGKPTAVDPSGMYGGSGANYAEYQPQIDASRNYLSSQYSGGNQVAYQPDSSIQEIGGELGDDSKFNALMDSTYAQKAGGQLSSGQLSLQHQLDQESPSVAAARKALASRYGGLQTLAGDKSKEVNDALTSGAQAYSQGQDGYRQTLRSQMADLEGGGITNDEAPQYEAIKRALGM